MPQQKGVRFFDGHFPGFVDNRLDRPCLVKIFDKCNDFGQLDENMLTMEGKFLGIDGLSHYLLTL